MTKTECIILGPPKERLHHQTHVCHIKINKDTLKCLGIYVELNKNICTEKKLDYVNKRNLKRLWIHGEVENYLREMSNCKLAYSIKNRFHCNGFRKYGQ